MGRRCQAGFSGESRPRSLRNLEFPICRRPNSSDPAQKFPETPGPSALAPGVLLDSCREQFRRHFNQPLGGVGRGRRPPFGKSPPAAHTIPASSPSRVFS